MVDFNAGDREIVSFSSLIGIADFTDLVNNHLVSDSATGFAKIVVGADSLLLQGFSVSDFGEGKPLSANDFDF